MSNIAAILHMHILICFLDQAVFSKFYATDFLLDFMRASQYLVIELCTSIIIVFMETKSLFSSISMTIF